TPGNNQMPAAIFGGDLSSLGTVTSFGDTLSITIQADGTNSCADGGVEGEWNFQIRCSGCYEPEGDLFLVEDCGTQTFTAALDLYYLGYNGTTGDDATSATIVYSVNGVPQTDIP